MRATLHQQNFAAGQIRKDLWGRTDSAKYQSGLKKLRNCFINKAGILYNTPGTTTILPGKFPAKKNRIISWKFSFNLEYLLILGDQYMHFVKNGKVISEGFDTVLAFPNAANPFIHCSGAGTAIIGYWKVGDMVWFSGVTGAMSQFLNGRFFILSQVYYGNAGDIKINDLYGNPIDSTNWGTGGFTNAQINHVYELTTPYAYADLALIKCRQSFDIAQLRHPLYPPQELKKGSDTSWNLSRKAYWPSQLSLASTITGSGGGGSSNYFYKCSTYNMATKQESFCGNISSGAPVASYNLSNISFMLNYQNITNNLQFLWGSYPGVVGDTIAVSQNLYDFSGRLCLIASKLYKVTAITGTYFTTTSETPTIYNSQGQCPSNFIIYRNGLPSIKITSISNPSYPMSFQTSATIPFLSGDEIMIQNTGIFGIDGNIFIATKIDNTHFSINGVNSADYDLTSFVSNQGSAQATAYGMATSPSLNSPITLSFAFLGSNTDSVVFKFYASQNRNGPFGFIGYANPGANNATVTFLDQGIPPDPTLNPKGYTPIFIGTGNYPSACNFYQQRLVELATINHPQGLYASVQGDYNDFSTHNPLQENDAILMDIWSSELEQIFDSADSGFLVLITDIGPMVAAGDTTGEFTPSVNVIKRYAYAGGTQQPAPLHIFKNIVYLEASQASIRDLEVLVTPFYTYIDKSDDVSLFSEDLISVSILIDWDYKQYLDSQIFAVRADGKALAITYFKEQEIQAFSWMDTNNGNDDFLGVSCVQEGTETFVYWLVKRDTGIWIERMNSRYYKDATIDAVFTHASASYNGLITDGTTAVLSGSTSAQGVVTVTLSTNEGANYAVGTQVNFRYIYDYDQYGNPLSYIARIKVTSNGTNTITGTLFEAINSVMIGPTISDIRICSNIVQGLWHLNGKNVSINADGFDIADPNDSTYPLATVTNGQVIMPGGNAYGVINVGLPYLSDVQTLDIDEEKGETFMDKLIGIHQVSVKFLNTGSIWVGPNFTEYLTGKSQMDRFPMRNADDGYLTPTKLFTGIKMIPIDTKYGHGGSFALRNTGPHPMTVLKIAPRVQVQS